MHTSQMNSNRLILPNYWRLFLVLVLILGFAGASYTYVGAAGTIYYVDNTSPSCSDTGTGTSSKPFCTISKGASVAGGGDIVRVLAGTYAETVTPKKSGSAGLPITFQAAPGVKVTGAAAAGSNGFKISSKSYVTVDGFTITGTSGDGIYVSTSNNIIISNNKVSYSGQPLSGVTARGIRFSNVNNSIITGNTASYNTQDGIRLDSGCFSVTISNNISFGNAEQWQRNATGIGLHNSYSNTIIHNITYANEDTGVNSFDNSHDNFVIGNLTYGNGDHGIDNNGSPGNTITGNTVHGNYTAGINVEASSYNTTIANNITADNGMNPSSGQPSNIRVESTSISGTTLDYDILYLTSNTVMVRWGGTSYYTLADFQAAVPAQETHGLQVDPLFQAAAPVSLRPASAPYNVAVNVGDYHVNAGSPAIDSANSNAVQEPTADLDGNPRVDDPFTSDTGVGARTFDDRGVYEFQPLGMPTATFTSTPTATFTNTPLPTSTPTSLPTNTPTATPTNTPLPTATFTNTPLPTSTFTATPTIVPGSLLTFVPNADAYVRADKPRSNFGAVTVLWADGGTDPNYESYLRFAVSGVTGTVQKAVLRVYSTSATTNAVSAYGTSNTWTESTINWNTKPALTTGVLDSKGPIATSAWTEFNVTSLVTGDGTYNVVLAMSNIDGVSFSSREGSQPPQLVLTIAISPTATNTPLPTATSTNTTEPTATDTALPTATAAYTLEPTATSTDTPVPPTDTATVVPFTPVPTDTPTSMDIPTPTDTPVVMPTFTPADNPTDTPTDPPVPSNTPEVTATNTMEPTATPTDTQIPPTATTIPFTATPTWTNTPLPTATYTPTPTSAPYTLILSPVADAYVRVDKPSTNYGLSTSLWADGGINPAYESYLRFDASGVTGTIQSAVLRLYVTNGTVNGPALYLAGNTWSESTITWNTRPARTSGVIEDKGALSTGAWVEYNVSPVLMSNGTYSFVLTMDNVDAISFSSREGTQPPQLVLTILP